MTQIYLAICAIFRDETPYLAEWIAFHRLVGVEHFFLYDNYSVDNPESVLAPFIEEGLVTLCRWEIPFHQQAQKKAYNDCLQKVQGKVQWLAYIDIDEFLFAPQQQQLTTVLRNYVDYPGIVVRWQVYGSSGHEKASDEPVIARFQHRAKTDWIRNYEVKTICNPNKVKEIISIHCFLYQDGQQAVDENKNYVKVIPSNSFKKKIRQLYFYRLFVRYLPFLHPFAPTKINNQTVSVNHLRINHYIVKSKEEFYKKDKGVAKLKNKYIQTNFFFYNDRNEVHDPILTRYLPDLEKMISSYKKHI